MLCAARVSCQGVPVSELSTIAERFFDRYAYPDWLRTHSRLVGVTGAFLARARVDAGDRIDVDAVTLASYLHDIGRSPLLNGDPRDHNELSALVLAAEGLAGCVEPARRHAIYTVLDPATAPRTLEEKVVYVADRRGGMEVQSLEERAKDTAARHPRYATEVERAIPTALRIEREVFAGLPFAPAQLADVLRSGRPT
jgi:HD superfamily phosphodiesterase